MIKRFISHYLRSNSQTAQFLRFATVGVKISGIDAGLVYLLPWLFDINLYLARVISLGTSILVGYVLHRYFTFGGIQQGCFYRQMAGHIGVHLTGGLINYGFFSLVIVVGHHVLDPGVLRSFLPLIAIWLGGLIGMSFNYFFSRKLVFQSETQNANAIS